MVLISDHLSVLRLCLGKHIKGRGNDEILEHIWEFAWFLMVSIPHHVRRG